VRDGSLPFRDGARILDGEFNLAVHVAMVGLAVLSGRLTL
jgi:hypothetical protein